jgi:chorismate dehydratase
MYRLGIIKYTNVAPLLHSLERELEAQNLEWTRGVPTEINAALLEGRVDLANISAFEFIQNADKLRALPDFSISVLGAVYSVNLFHTVPWAELEGCAIAVTTHSATSVRLLETLLELDGINAKLERVASLDVDALLESYPAVLLIGDAALEWWYRVCGPISDTAQMHRLPHQGALSGGGGSTRARGVKRVTVTDLAMSWYAHTGLPFVFAVWASRRDNPPPFDLVLGMRRARRWGVGHLAEVAGFEAQRLNLPERIVQHYLWNFRYHLEAPDRAGLERFARLSCPQNAERLTFWDV